MKNKDTVSTELASQTMIKRQKVNLNKDAVLTKLKSNVRADEKLSIGINYLNHLKAVDMKGGAKEYIQESAEIMKLLTNEFKNEEAYKAWVRYFDVANKSYGDYEDTESFKLGTSNLVQELLLGNGTSIQDIDWRIAKKILGVKKIFTDGFIENIKIDPASLFEPIKAKMIQTLDYLDWSDNAANVSLAGMTINKLLDIFNDQSKKDIVQKAIISGRFDKQDSGLEDTIIFGEDGGMYLLFNSVDGQKRAILEQVTSPQYLTDKVKGQKENKEKIIIGEGGFGKVRFAMNLLEGNAKPGEIICIKKSKNFKVISEGFGSGIEVVTDGTIGDYFTNDIAKIIYAPKILDMAIISDKAIKDSLHKKGYLMMEVVPQNTGTKIFSQPEYQKWEYQKPYLLDVFNGVKDLLYHHHVVMTDLKPDNTLYDKDLRKATIIDLGGTVKLDHEDEIGKFSAVKYSSLQYTAEFAAPELKAGNKGEDKEIDISKSLVYGCGKVMEGVTNNSDYNKGILQNFIGNLVSEQPNDRMVAAKVMDELAQMGSDEYKASIIFSHYISKVKDRIKANKGSINLNDDIEQTRDLYINLDATTLDPYRYKDQNRQDLFKKVDNFLISPENNNEVFLLLGVAGSGKSIVLQLKFMEAVNNWKPGLPLPIYFNLASDIELSEILRKMNQELKTDISIKNLLGQQIHLYVDSFDEGIGISEVRESLIQGYLEQLGNKPGNKLLVSCRQDYLQNDSDEIWFMPNSKAMEKYYIAPLDYSNKAELEKNVDRYTKYQSSKQNNNSIGQSKNNEMIKIDINVSSKIKEKDTAWYMNKIANNNLTDVINTGFMFQMMMDALPDIKTNDLSKQQITKQDIYQQYVNNYKNIGLTRLNNKQQEKIKEIFKGYNNDSFYDDLAQYLASELHIGQKFRIEKESELFKLLNYQAHRDFKYQLGSHLLKVLPIKLESKRIQEENGKVKEEIAIGFVHDTIKNYYLVQAITKQLLEGAKANLLASRNIVDNVELIRFMVETVETSELWQKNLLNAIYATREDKSAVAITYAANAITLLVAAKYSFSGEDLSRISIKGANIRNGLFQYTDFTKADLTDVNLTNANLVGAKLINTIMTGVKLGVVPDLEYGYSGDMTYSPDGKYIATSFDETVTIWEASSGKNLQTINKNLQTINKNNGISDCLAYSPDGKYIATASNGKTVKILEVSSGKILQTIEGHDGRIINVAYSPDGKYLATSDDKTAKIWDVSSGKNLTLESYYSSIIAYSPDGKYIASGSRDKTVKIWEASTGKIVQTLDDCNAKSIAYSPDGKYIAAGLGKTVAIWDASTGKMLQILNNYNDSVDDIAYSPDGKYLAISTEEIIIILDINSGKNLQTLSGHTMRVYGIAYSPDGLHVASISSQGVKIWEVGINKNLQTLSNDRALFCLVYSPDGKYLATGSDGNTAKIWDASSGKILQTINHTFNHVNVDSIAYSPDRKYFATGVGNDAVKIWEVSSGKILQTINCNTPIKDITYSPDGKYLATGVGNNAVKIWEVGSGELWKTFNRPLDNDTYVSRIACSPDGKYIATSSYDAASRDKTVKICEASSGKILRTINCNTCIKDIAYSPDGKYLATGFSDNAVKIWEVSSGKILRTISANDWKICSLAYSPNGKYLATGVGDETVKIWEVSSGKILQTISANDKEIDSIAYSSDGKYIAISGNHTVKIANVNSVRILHTLDYGFKGHNNAYNIAYSPDGKYIAIGTEHGTAQIWDVSSEKILQTLGVNHDSPYSMVAYSPDGKYLATGSYDTVKIWTNKYGKWVIVKEISATESHLTTNDMIVDSVINLSEKNEKVFEQRHAKIKNKTKIIELKNDENYDFDMSEFNKYLATKTLEQLKLKVFTEAKHDDLKNDPNHINVNINSINIMVQDQSAQKKFKIDTDCSKDQKKENISNAAKSDKSNVQEGTQDKSCCESIKEKCLIFVTDQIKYDNLLLNDLPRLYNMAQEYNISLNDIITLSATYQDFAALEIDLIGNMYIV